MTDFLPSQATNAVRSIRTFLAVSGALALVTGLLLLIWPGKSAVIVTGIVASYLIIGGLVYLALAVFSGRDRGWMRIGHSLLGLLYIVAGVIAFANLAAATVTFALIVAVFVGVSWIFDGVVALSLLGTGASKVWTWIYAIIGILAGVFVLLSPLYAAVVLWIMLGATLVALGVVQIVRAITLKEDLATLTTY